MHKLRLSICLLAALSLSLWAWAPIAKAQGIGPAVTIYCNKTAQLTGAAAITQMVPAVAGQTITICGWHVTNTAATGTFQFTYGTGAACVTGNNPITPVFSVSNTAPSSDHTDYGHLPVPPGNGVCVTPSAVTVAILLYYATS